MHIYKFKVSREFLHERIIIIFDTFTRHLRKCSAAYLRTEKLDQRRILNVNTLNMIYLAFS